MSSLLDIVQDLFLIAFCIPIYILQSVFGID